MTTKGGSMEIVEPGSFGAGVIVGAGGVLAGFALLFTWAMCAIAKDADKAKPERIHVHLAEGYGKILDNEAASYEFTEYNVPTRDLPWAS